MDTTTSERETNVHTGDRLLEDILALIHQREVKLQTELAKLAETKRLLMSDTAGAAAGLQAGVRDTLAGAIGLQTGTWSEARKARHSRMMKKRWAAKKREAKAKGKTAG